MDKLGSNIADTPGGKRTSRTLLVVFVALLFTLAIGGTYIWQNGRINDLNQQVKRLNTQVDTLKSQNQQASDPTSNTLPIQAPYTYTSGKSVTVKILSPQSNDKVSSPLVVVGQVPGDWSFEASFPVKIMDSNGNVIAQTAAQVIGNWMTHDLVPFSAQLTWSTTETGNGTLVLQKDNPSGLSENDDTVSIPIKF